MAPDHRPLCFFNPFTFFLVHEQNLFSEAKSPFSENQEKSLKVKWVVDWLKMEWSTKKVSEVDCFCTIFVVEAPAVSTHTVCSLYASLLVSFVLHCYCCVAFVADSDRL